MPHPVGLDVRGTDDLAGALASSARAARRHDAVLKLDLGVSGLGNALLDLDARGDDLAPRSSSRTTRRSTSSSTSRRSTTQGGIVEERIEGEDFRSPSVQLRMSPSGQVDIMSTHDQVLGGAHGQTYFGCHFPADPEYAPLIAAEALKVGRRLAREGVIGRARSTSPRSARRRATGSSYALEINLRCGGTTHPLFALTSLTDGVYDPLAGRVAHAARRPQALRRDRPPRLARPTGR